MSVAMISPLIDALYWLSLATWFGCVLTSAIVPPIIMRVILHADPTLPRVLSVNLDKQHSTLLAGDVIGAILATLFRLEAFCALALVLPLVGKWFTIHRTGVNLLVPILVTALYLLALAFLLYGWRIVWPKVLKHRQTYLDNADDPDIANVELDAFDRYSTELFSVVRNMLFALLGAILFSAAMQPTAITFVASN